MTFTAQIDDLATALKQTRSRLLAPIAPTVEQLPRDTDVFVEDVLLYVMDEWAADLKAQGHVLEEDTTWADDEGSFPRFMLHMTGGAKAQVTFSGEYPRALYLSISKGFRNGQQFSDARQVQFEVPITMDPNKLLVSILDGLRENPGH